MVLVCSSQSHQTCISSFSQKNASIMTKMEPICLRCRTTIVVHCTQIVRKMWILFFSKSIAVEQQSSESSKRGSEEKQNRRLDERDRNSDRSSRDSDRDPLSTSDRQMVCFSDILLLLSLLLLFAVTAANANTVFLFKWTFSLLCVGLDASHPVIPTVLKN